MVADYLPLLRDLSALLAAFTVYYEPRPGLPLVYGSTREELVLELSLLDIDPAGHPYFVVGTDKGPVSISVSPDLFQWAPTIIDGVPVHTLSPLALVHIRAGATATGAFGPPRPEKGGTRHSRRVDVFLSNVDPAQLEPTVTPISEPQ